MSIYQVFDNAREQLARSATSNSGLFRDAVPTDDLEIRKLLNSSSTRDQSAGMRALFAHIGEGMDCHRFFADVVKNVSSKDIEVRQMTASFLIMYSQHEPELTLMIVNSVQKMIGNPSAVVRMQALRLASALRVPTVVPIVTHLITELVDDVSPLVRAACLQAIGKCYDLDPSLSDELLELLTHTLSLPKQLNGNYEVAGWGIATLAQYWPQRIDLLHPFFRVYVPHIPKFNEWCQIAACRMFVRYCRHYLTGPDDEDSKLLSESVVPLLFSNNDAVVVEAAAVLLYVGLPDMFSSAKVAGRLLNLKPSAIAWSNTLKFCQVRPECFAPHRSDIILNLLPSDTPAVRRLALKCAIQCGGPELTKAELAHLKFCAVAWQEDQMSVRVALEAIAALAGPKYVSSAMKWLVKTATDKRNSPQLISESLMCLRVMVQQHRLGDVSATLVTLTELAVSEQILPSAKATIIWLLGTYCVDHSGLAAELLRKLLRRFATEAAVVRLQTLQLAAKLYTSFKNDSANLDPRVPEFFQYAVQLCKYDPDIDIRDRARLFSTLLEQSDNSMATLLLQAATPIPTSTESKRQDDDAFIIDSAGAFFGKRLDAYTELEPWAKQDETKNLRLTVAQISPKSSSPAPVQKPSAETSRRTKAAAETKQMSLQEFLNPTHDGTKKTGSATSSEASSSEEDDEESEFESESEEEEEEEN